MKNFGVLLLVLTVVIVGCEKDDTYQFNAHIGINEVTSNSITVSGSVYTVNSTTTVDRGVAYAMNPGANYYDAKVSGGSGNGTFTITISNLFEGTTYYLRVYGSHGGSIYYGDEIAVTTLVPPPAIGDSGPGGGKIFYIDSTGGGFEVINTQSNALWGCNTEFIPNLSDSLGAGQSNTTQIISNCPTNGIAADVCNELTNGGKTDWFLPSIDELTMVYDSLIVPGKMSVPVGVYLSSSQADTTIAKGISTTDGATINCPKGSIFKFLAVREF